MKVILRVDGNTDEILAVYNRPDDYELAEYEFELPDGAEKPQPSKAYIYDRSTDTLEQNSMFASSERVDRGEMSSQTKTAFRDARSNDDVQAQLDILFEILTGEHP